MFLCSLIDELCTKEESNKTGWFFHYFDNCIKNSFSAIWYLLGMKLLKWSPILLISNACSVLHFPLLTSFYVYFYSLTDRFTIALHFRQIGIIRNIVIKYLSQKHSLVFSWISISLLNMLQFLVLQSRLLLTIIRNLYIIT